MKVLITGVSGRLGPPLGYGKDDQASPGVGEVHGLGHAAAGGCPGGEGAHVLAKLPGTAGSTVGAAVGPSVSPMPSTPSAADAPVTPEPSSNAVAGSASANTSSPVATPEPTTPVATEPVSTGTSTGVGGDDDKGSPGGTSGATGA